MVALVAPQGALATAPSAQGTLIVVRLVQPWNEFERIELGVPSNVSEVKLPQSQKAILPIAVIPEGKLVKANFLQEEKALLPITVIPEGKAVKDKLLQPENA